MATRRVPIRVILGIGVLAATFGGAGIALAADHAVAISGFSFSPASITVAVGDTVTWTNSDAQAHTATADGGSFDTGTIANGGSGTVTVQGAAGGGAAASPPATDTRVEAPSAGSSPGAVALLLLVASWLVAVAIARHRFTRPNAAIPTWTDSSADSPRAEGPGIPRDSGLYT